MKKFICFFSKKGLVRNLLLSLFVACTAVSILSYTLYYYNTFRILEKRLALQTQSQLALNNQDMARTFETLDMISNNLLNSLYQYDSSHPLSYITTLNELTGLENMESIRLANYTLNTLSFYIANYPILDSISLYTGSGTVISSSATHTKTQILDTSSGDFILDTVIPDFDRTNTSFQWLGSLEIQDFVLGNSRAHYSHNPNHVFTGIRRIVNNSRNHEIFLVFCVKPDVLRDTYYTYPITSDLGSVFLLDASGIIHFSDPADLVGAKSPYANRLIKRGTFESFTETSDGQQLNLFYQSLDYTDFFVLYEIPADAYASDIVSLKKMAVFLFLCTLVLLSAAVLWVVTRKLRPLKDLTRAASYIGSGNLGYTIPVRKQSSDEIDILTEKFNLMSQDLQNLMLQKEQAEEQKRLQEIAALQAQINPHFILNTINTVKWMAILNHAPNISECLTTFGKLLEPLLRLQTRFYTIKDELSYLENYVAIMNYSHGNTIQMRNFVPDELLNCKIPRFILQPLVENAVLHGVEKATNNVLIEISMSATNNVINIVVLSHGTIIDDNKLQSLQESLLSDSTSTGTSGIGLSNVNKRIHAFYGDGYGIWIENSSDDQVRVSVTIPLESLY